MKCNLSKTDCKYEHPNYCFDYCKGKCDKGKACTYVHCDKAKSFGPRTGYPASPKREASQR